MRWRMRDGSNHEDPFVIDAAIAYAGQAALERLLVHVLDNLWSQTKTPNLCLVGGVALNSLANGKIPSLTHFTNVHVFDAPGDSGTAIGAAIWKRVQGEERNTQKLRFFWSPYLGREYLEGESRAALAASCLVAKRPKNLHRDVAELLVRGRTVGWCQGGGPVRPASARPSKYPRGSATIQHAGPYQSPHQGKRMVSAPSSRGRGVSGRRILRASRSIAVDAVCLSRTQACSRTFACGNSR